MADTASYREQVSLQVGRRSSLLAPLDVITGLDREHVRARLRTLSLQEGIDPKDEQRLREMTSILKYRYLKDVL